MNIARGLVYLLFVGLIFGMIVIPTYIVVSGLPFWTDLAAVAPAWFVGALKLMPGIALVGLIYGAYKHFADRNEKPENKWPDLQ